MAVNKREKGNRNERLVRDILLENGYDYVIKSGGSLGMFDLIGYKFGDKIETTAFIQVKSNRLAEPPAREKVKNFVKDEDCGRIKKQIWIVYDGNAHNKKPPIRILSYEGANSFEYFYGFEHHNGEYDKYLQYIF